MCFSWGNRQYCHKIENFIVMNTVTEFPFIGQNGEHIIYVVESQNPLSFTERKNIEWILAPNILEPAQSAPPYNLIVGPNLRFETPESEKLRTICASIGLKDILRIEKFTVHFRVQGKSIEYDKMTESVYEEIPETLIPVFESPPVQIIDLLSKGKPLFKQINKEFGMGMDNFDIDYYCDLFVNIYKRNPTDVELMQVSQGNSSHCRHWEFSGNITIDGKKMTKTLFQMVKDTLKKNPEGSIKAFKDNGGILRGNLVCMFMPGPNGMYRKTVTVMHHTATAETHNHPTLISPYPGAATGVGGRLRDSAAIGKGSLIGFGGVYFQTGKLWLRHIDKTMWGWKYNPAMGTPREVLVGAIKGASGYGNPFGEPTLLFGNDSLGIMLENKQRFETVKPIIYTCGVGSIPADAPDKAEAEPGMIIVRIGGATRRIGVGGGAASSMNSGENTTALDFASVQRGEPMVGRSAYNVIEHCIFMGDKNPIEAIHDQGAGGASNVITELTNPSGGIIDLAKIQIADTSLSKYEIWISESQELYGILLKPENLELFTAICNEYHCPIEILGGTNDSHKITVIDSRDNSIPVDLTLPEILGNLPQKSYTDETAELHFKPFQFDGLVPVLVKDQFELVATVPGVAFLDYMVDHFDGSVGGRVVQGPRDGKYQLPICTYAILSDSFAGLTGCVSTFTRSNPVAMLIDEEATARMTVAQMLATLSFVHIPDGTSRIKGRLNVMWPFKQKGMKAKLYSAYSAMTKALTEVGIGIDGGKDSLSLSVTFDGESITSFPTFIIEPYAHVSDFRTRVTPALKGGAVTDLILIELGRKRRMGGSALAEATDQTGDTVPDADPKKAKNLFKMVQYLVRKKMILAGSPKLKGGILPTVAKMSIASDVEAHIENPQDSDDTVFYFNEEIGVIVQCDKSETKRILAMANGYGLNARSIGWVKPTSQYFTYCDDKNKYSPFADEVRKLFKETGRRIKEYLGIDLNKLTVGVHPRQHYLLSFNPDETKRIPKDKTFNVAVLAAPGTNGHHELAYMFGRMKKQFKVQLIQMEELRSGKYDLKDFNVIAFAGGFSYGDVGGSGKGWAASILYNKKLKKMFDNFFDRPDTLSFGVCNGFQVATLLGVFNSSIDEQPLLLHNDSGMFEHHSVNLLIPENTKSIMLQGMGGSVLPAWSAHGEGKLFLPDQDYDLLGSLGSVAVYYADGHGKPTTDYPSNPNGSPYGIAGLCTKDGRHTFMMPHIERVSASNHHLPYRPKDWTFKNPVWLKAIENMYLWLYSNVKQI